MAFEIVSFVQDKENENFQSIAFQNIDLFLKTCFSKIFDARYTNTSVEASAPPGADFDLETKSNRSRYQR